MIMFIARLSSHNLVYLEIVMKRNPVLKNAFYAIALCALIAMIVALTPVNHALAATPPNGTITSSTDVITFEGGPFFYNNVTPTVEYVCLVYGVDCDEFDLTINLPANEAGAFDVVFTIEWGNDVADFDVYLLEGDTVLADSASSSNPETVSVCASNRDLHLDIVPFTPLGESYTAEVKLVPRSVACGAAGGPAEPLGDGGVGAGFINPQVGRYQVYTDRDRAGDGLVAQGAGEPTMGVNWNTGAAMFVAGLETVRVSFNDDYNQSCSSPAEETWTEVSVITHVNTLDPILFTDPVTGLTISSQLAGKASLIGSTVNNIELDGGSPDADGIGDGWTISPLGAGINSGVDHQTIGGGPYTADYIMPPTQTYTHAVYYCSQDIAYANCARSDDGGIVFGAAVPMYTLTECGGLHGHVEVGPDGVVYTPNGSCGGQQGVAVSEDNGLTWDVRTVPDSTPDNGSDPSVAMATDGTVYFGFVDTNGQMKMTKSTDHGVTWSESIDVGAQLGIEWAVFPAVVAGDPDRAAVAFVGSLGDAAGNNYEDTANFKGEWYLFVSHTYDGGATWTTVNATPFDPVQRGSICNGGTTCGGDRNLLDFNDAVLDERGYVLAAYADGCVGDCIDDFPNTFSDVGSIARQEGGLPLFSAFDPVLVDVPKAPRLDSVGLAVNKVFVDWSEPDNGGSPLTGYEVLRAASAAGPFEKIADVRPNKTIFVDTEISELQDQGQTEFHYQVKAVNVVGSSIACNSMMAGDIDISTTVAEACSFPGKLAVTDPNEAKTDRLDAYDILGVFIAEPIVEDPADAQFIFSLQVQATAEGTFTPPVASEYRIDFTYNGVDYSFIYGSTLNSYTYTGSDGSSGTLDGNYTNEGLISWFFPKSLLPALPVVGEVISDISGYANSTEIIPIGLPVGQSTDIGSYTVVSLEGCTPNFAPFADFTVTPSEGQSPLTVQFNAMDTAAGRESSDPDGDELIEYRWDFGDGTTATTTGPTVQHTYTNDSETSTLERRAYLTVIDAKGKPSPNNSFAGIEIQPAGGIPTAIFTNQTTAAGNQVMALIGIGLIMLLTVAVGGVTVMRRKSTP